MINSHVFVVGKTPFFNSQLFNYVPDVYSEFSRSAFENPRGFETGFCFDSDRFYRVWKQKSSAGKMDGRRKLVVRWFYRFESVRRYRGKKSPEKCRSFSDRFLFNKSHRGPSFSSSDRAAGLISANPENGGQP